MKRTKTAAKDNNTRKAKPVSAKKATDVRVAKKKEAGLPLYCNRKNPFTPEAWDYVNQENLWPGTEKPLCFMPPPLVFKLDEAQGRPLDLEQVKSLVFPEGPDAVMCSLTKESADEEKFFTPVNYAYAISPKGLKQVEEGVPFDQVLGFFRGGPYYVNRGRTEAKAFSGSPFRFKVSRGGYWRNDGSPLVIMAIAAGSVKCPSWGVPFSEIQRLIDAQARKTALNAVASKMAAELTNGRVRYRDRDRDSWTSGDGRFDRLNGLKIKRKKQPRENRHEAEETASS